jgi:hypothetical protein
VAEVAKLQRSRRNQEAPVQAQDSVALGGSCHQGRGKVARSWQGSVLACAAMDLALLGDGVWKGHSV